jgi:hypothetical protein
MVHGPLMDLGVSAGVDWVVAGRLQINETIIFAHCWLIGHSANATPLVGLRVRMEELGKRTLFLAAKVPRAVVD